IKEQWIKLPGSPRPGLPAVAKTTIEGSQTEEIGAVQKIKTQIKNRLRTINPGTIVAKRHNKVRRYKPGIETKILRHQIEALEKTLICIFGLIELKAIIGRYRKLISPPKQVFVDYRGIESATRQIEVASGKLKIGAKIVFTTGIEHHVCIQKPHTICLLSRVFDYKHTGIIKYLQIIELQQSLIIV